MVKDMGTLCFYQRLLKLGKYHFCIMSERTLRYRTDNVRAKCSKSQKWEGKRGALKRHVCVGWCVKWNSLWRYTTLPSYNFIEWMISMIVTVRLWRHSNIVWIRPDLFMIGYVWKGAIFWGSNSSSYKVTF